MLYTLYMADIPWQFSGGGNSQVPSLTELERSLSVI